MILANLTSASQPVDASPVDILQMIFLVVGGLGIFLLGMKNMSEGLQSVAGNRLRTMIHAVTNNRLVGVGVGASITMLIQSSSATTVIVVGFINAGFMTLVQGLGVIMGANIGTTVTGWIIALNVGKYGLIILGVSAMIHLFSKHDRVKYLGMVGMGFGMLFFGLLLMKQGFAPIKDIPEFEEWFVRFQAVDFWGVVKCAAVGAIMTMIVQSSSATVGITMALALEGTIGFNTAAALVLGENIGTTVTAVLASLGTNTNAKRAAWGHVVMKVIGVSIIIPLFFPYIDFVKWIIKVPDPNVCNEAGKYVYMGFAIASTHTIFNVANTLFFLPFVKPLAKFLNWLIPDKGYQEMDHLTLLDARLVDTPVVGIEQCQLEILKMAQMVTEMMNKLGEITPVKTPQQQAVEEIFKIEDTLDGVQKEITVFITQVLGEALPLDDADQARRQLRIADEYESMSDYAASILKRLLKLNKAGYAFSDKQKEDILRLHCQVSGYLEMVYEVTEKGQVEAIADVRAESNRLSHFIRDLRDSFLTKITTRGMNSMVIVFYTDILNAYRRIKDHALNVGEAVAKQK